MKKPPSSYAKGCDCLAAFLGILAVVAAVIAVTGCSGKAYDPPESFRGIKWDSELPPVSELQKTVLKGCSAVIEQTHFKDEPLCSHMHIETDDIESFSQRQNVPPIFNVPVSEQLFTWSYGKFWSGEVFIDSANNSDLAALRNALIDRYGSPTFENDELGVTKWAWPDRKIMISLYMDNRSTISLLFGRSD